MKTEKEEIKFKQMLVQNISGVHFALTNQKRGQFSPIENKTYPEYYLEMCSKYSGSSIGRVYFDEIDNKTVRVHFYPEDRGNGFTAETIGLFNKYINFIQKEYKQLKK